MYCTIRICLQKHTKRLFVFIPAGEDIFSLPLYQHRLWFLNCILPNGRPILTTPVHPVPRLTIKYGSLPSFPRTSSGMGIADLLFPSAAIQKAILKPLSYLETVFMLL